MTDIPITDIGVGGAIAIIFLREGFKWMREIKNGKNGEYIKRSEFAEHKKNVVYKDNCALIKEFNKERFDGIDSKLKQIEALIKNGGK